MINFFRKKRKTLADNPFYVKASGGAKALNINSWNKNRKLENEKHKLILALKQEFLSYKETLEIKYKDLKTSNSYLYKILNFSAGITTNVSVDSLRLYTLNIVNPFYLLHIKHLSLQRI